MIFQTSNMEAAILLLAKHFDRVLVRYRNRLRPPIRLQLKKLAKVTPYIRRQHVASEDQVEAWRANGGVLISYYRDTMFETPHDVRLFTECPFSLRGLGRVDVPVVVYRPPSWERHTEEFPHQWVDSHICRQVYREIKAARPIADPVHAEMFEALGFETKGVAAVTDRVLLERLGMAQRHLNRARREVFRNTKPNPCLFVLPITPRTEPEDKSLLLMYRTILALRQFKGQRLVLGGELQAVQFWKSPIKRLERCGSIKVMDRIGFYTLDEVKPDYPKIRWDHQRAKARLALMIKTIDRAPELTEKSLEKLCPSRPAPPRASVSPGLPAAGAHAGDTAR